MVCQNIIQNLVTKSQFIKHKQEIWKQNCFGGVQITPAGFQQDQRKITEFVFVVYNHIVIIRWYTLISVYLPAGVYAAALTLVLSKKTNFKCKRLSSCFETQENLIHV